MLRGRDERKTLVAFLDWLLDPGFAPKIRPSQTEVELRKVRQEISHLKQLTGYYINQAVSKLQKEERLIAAERAYRTYQSPFMTRKAPKELGNVEETERLFVAVLIARKLHPRTNPYIFLREQLERRGDHRTRLAIQMRVRRFEKKLDGSKYFSPRQIVEQHYLRFKLHVMWSSSFGQHLATTLEKLKTATSGEQQSGSLKPWPRRDFQKMQRFSRLSSIDRKVLDDLCS